MSERKAFNFYKSYLDVYQELKTDKEKIQFIEALLNRQFYGTEPTDLKGMAKFAYVSQKEVIDKQIKGWEDKTGNTLSYPTQGGLSTPSVQEEEKGQEEVEYTKAFESKSKFLEWFNGGKKHYTGSEGKTKDLKSTDLNNFNYLNKTYSRKDFAHALKLMSYSKWVQDNAMFTPAHFLRSDNFTKYLNQELKDVMSPDEWYQYQLKNMNK